ncbi:MULTISPECIES: TonB-dependent receptor [unclassified Variovorax]|uniref:TonB-dependent siderophore receptor n=1 Tax=unclassified Variovorax TaxID=663243 RepID=UPI00257855D5|nr:MULTISPECIES: TonB-dependent receptor [unclassified Variovorax]MDM0089835.1 TonB-dependent siderophore receptor [Variovorax sp. J22G40]MDM0148499.1 TonB-dependent siderophore receptor [Variovorax sp. J2P1-31]
MPSTIRRTPRAPLSHAVLLACLSIGLGAATPFAAAQPSQGTPAVMRHDIPAGTLDQALNRFAATAGILLAIDGALTSGRSSPGLSGSYGPREGLAALLAGSGLEAARSSNGEYVLRRVPTAAPVAPGAAAAEPALPSITVTAQAGRDATSEGTGAYATRSAAAGTGLDLTQRETPQSMSVVTRQQMDDQNLSTLTDVLRQTPGIATDTLDERVLFTSRGFELVTLLDGVPTKAFTTVAGASDMLSTTVYDRVEVVRGASGLMDGVGAPGGAINLIRKRPGTDFSGHVSAGVGSWDRYAAEADLGGSLNAAGTLRARVVASHNEGHSFTEFKKRREDVLYGIVEADLAPGTVLALGLEYQKTAIDGAEFGQTPLFFSDGSRTRFPRSYNHSARWSNWDMESQRAFVNLSHQFDGGWQLKLDASYLKSERQRSSGDFYAYSLVDRQTGDALIDMRDNPAAGTNKSLDIKAKGPFDLFGRTHEAVVGSSFSRYDYHIDINSSVPGAIDRRPFNFYTLQEVPKPEFAYPLYRTRGKTEETSLYGALRFQLAEPLALILGGRATWYENDEQLHLLATGGVSTNPPTRANGVFTPYAGVILDLDKTFSVYASYTDIFIPNVYKDANNTVLAPQRGTNLEAGIKGAHWGGRLQTSFAVFRTQEENVAVEDLGAAPLPDGTQPYRAVKGARSKGFEATVAGELATGWQLMGGYTYHAKRDREDVLLNPSFPTRLLRIATSHRLPGAWNRLTVGGSLSWQNAISYAHPQGVVTQGGLALIGLMARYDISKQLSASLNIENVGDKAYYAGLGGYNGYSYGAPRNAWLKMRYQF